MTTTNADVKRITVSVEGARHFEQAARLLRSYAASDGDSVLYLAETRKALRLAERRLAKLETAVNLKPRRRRKTKVRRSR